MNFNSNSLALKNRASVNSSAARHNLEDWILDRIELCPGVSVLDLGCGLGKQLFVYADKVGKTGSLLGFDLSDDSIVEVGRQIKERRLDNVRTVTGSFDDTIKILDGERFDRIIATYAIYYATDQVALMKDLKNNLNEGGVIFVCGPGLGTNQEISDVVASLTGNPVLAIENFLDQAEIENLSSSFADVQIYSLKNFMDIPSAQQVLDWWVNHNSYDASVCDDLTLYLKDWFTTHSSFRITKNVLGVVCYV